MIRSAADDLGLTRAADTCFAGGQNENAFLVQDLDDRFVGRDRNLLARFGQDETESAVCPFIQRVFRNLTRFEPFDAWR